MFRKVLLVWVLGSVAAAASFVAGCTLPGGGGRDGQVRDGRSRAAEETRGDRGDRAQRPGAPLRGAGGR